ncbi:MAG: hypothetical protein II874_04850 [Bacteroidales bacterium]|nr:hypothetical protein [Bacteroidales bacterium]
MKKFYSTLMILAAVATTFASCTKEIDNQDNEPVAGKMKTITVKTNIETRTTLDADHANLVWSSGDQISIFNDTDNTNSALTYSAGGDLTVQVPEETEFIYAHYPYYKDNKEGPTNVSVYISNKQTQKNPGELDGYYFPMVAKGTVTADNKAIISLAPVASALALNLYHTGLSGEETVESVTVTPSSNNTGFIGRQYSDLTQGNVVYSQAEASNAITVTLTNHLSLGSSKPADKQKFDGQIYVCLAKQSYANVKFEIKTNKGTYTITSSDTPFDCVNNDFVPVNINLAKATFEAPYSPENYTWNLVTGAISIGDKVVIAASESAKALSTTQQSNNRKGTNISKNGSTLTATSDVQAFEVVAGTTDGSFAFKAINGNTSGQYIYAASSGSNYLRTEKTLDDNGSWAVSISSAGVATVTAQGENTRNVLQYNSSSDIFACYASANQASVSIYKQGESADPDAKVILSTGDQEVSPIGGVYSISGAYTTQNIDENTETLNVTSSENITDVTILDGDIEFTMDPNYTTTAQNGTITITLASDETVTATIKVKQTGSTLTTSTTEVLIPYDSNEASFTLTSKDFSWSAGYTVVSGMNLTYSPIRGNASESAQTITVSSTTEATESVQLLGTIVITRNGNALDPQVKSIEVKKAAAPSQDATYYVKVNAVTSGRKYIMVDNTYNMIFNGASPAQPSAGVSTTGIVTANGIESTSTTDAYAVTITSDGAKYKVLLSTGNYLVINSSSSSNGSIGSSATGESITITKVDKGFEFISGNRSSRALVYRDGYDFRNYAVSNIGASGYGGYFDLYELSE